jgi:hypothetical protein
LSGKFIEDVRLRLDGCADGGESAEHREWAHELLLAILAGLAAIDMPVDRLAGGRGHALDIRFCERAIEEGAMTASVLKHDIGSDRLFNGLLQAVEHDVSVVLRDPEHIRDFGAIQALAQMEVQQGELLRVQPGRGLPNERGGRLHVCCFLRVSKPVYIDDIERSLLTFIVFEGERASASGAFQAVERGVAGDGEDPALEAGALLQAAERVHRLDERVLRDISRFVAVASHAGEEVVDRVEIACVKLGEG